MARNRPRSVFADRQVRSGSGRIRRLLLLILILALAGFVLYLGFADYGPEPAPVERQIPLERFQQ